MLYATHRKDVCWVRAIVIETVEGDTVNLGKGRRWRIVLGACAASALVVAASWYLLVPGRRFTPEQADRVQVGMTKEEITKVLGCPPGDYSNGTGYYAHIFGGYRVEDLLRNCPDSWCGEDGAIEFVFNSDGTLRSFDYWQRREPRPTLWERAVRWLPFKS
jgi:hypothetical protein